MRLNANAVLAVLAVSFFALLGIVMLKSDAHAGISAPQGYGIIESAQAITGTACTSLGSTDGVDLTNATGWRVIATAPTGQTFTGGSATCCFRSKTVGRWMECPAGLNLTTTSGKRDVTSPDQDVMVGMGRLKFVGNAVTLSSGTTFDLTYEVSQR